MVAKKAKKPQKEESEETPSSPKSAASGIAQPEINIGLVGHVDHGKTTLTSRLSGKWTDTHSEEVKRGITIRLGYANFSIYKCAKENKYVATEKCDCGEKTQFLRKVSLVDAPGHETLMATMLSGSAIMDYALLLVAANEKCPQPQTKEHLMALSISGLKKIIIIQNKVDLVTDEQAIQNYKEIKAFLKGTFAEHVPIIPISAQHGANIDILLEAIEKEFVTPPRDLTKDPIMFIARSFDVNKPGTPLDNLVGGVMGGALKQGKLKVGDKIEISPGRKVEFGGKTSWEPITTTIIDIKTGEESIAEAVPGGSIALSTILDPSLVKSDSLVGNLVGYPGKLPPMHTKLIIEPVLLDRVVGSEKELNVEPIKKGEALMLNVNASVTTGGVTALSKDAFEIALKRPICLNKDDRITISRLLGNKFRLIGYGKLK